VAERPKNATSIQNISNRYKHGRTWDFILFNNIEQFDLFSDRKDGEIICFFTHRTNISSPLNSPLMYPQDQYQLPQPQDVGFDIPVNLDEQYHHGAFSSVGVDPFTEFLDSMVQQPTGSEAHGTDIPAHAFLHQSSETGPSEAASMNGMSLLL
jgi:hypothetical protein